MKMSEETACAGTLVRQLCTLIRLTASVTRYEEPGESAHLC